MMQVVGALGGLAWLKQEKSKRILSVNEGSLCLLPVPKILTQKSLNVFAAEEDARY